MGGGLVEAGERLSKRMGRYGVILRKVVFQKEVGVASLCGELSGYIRGRLGAPRIGDDGGITKNRREEVVVEL